MKNAVALALFAALGFAAWAVLHDRRPHKPTRHVETEEVAQEEAPPPVEPVAAPAPVPVAAAPAPAAAPRKNSAQKRLHEMAEAARRAEAKERAQAAAAAGTPVDPTQDPKKLHIVEPDEKATDPQDKSARLAAQTYKVVVKAMKLEPEQEEKFMQVLYDTKTAYQNALKEADGKPLYDEKQTAEERTAALDQLSAARKKAWEDQKLVADEALQEVLAPDQFRIYSVIVQNPLFMANGLRFEAPPPEPAPAP